MNIQYFIAKILKKIRGSAIKGSVIHSTSKIESGCNIVNVKMDRYSFCGYDCEISNTDIGSFCSIANNVIIGGSMHPLTWVSTSPVFYAGKDSVKKKFSKHSRPDDMITYIGHDVWIGQYTMIKQGVTIGNGAVIGMGSVVTKDVHPYSIVAGNPAKLIRNRFEKAVCDELLQSKWWLLDDSNLEIIGDYITRPQEFIKKMK